MNLQSILKHMAAFWDIYQFIGGENQVSLKKVKEHLIKNLGQAESTARLHLSDFTKSKEGLITLENSKVSLDHDKVCDFLDELDEVLCFTDYDRRSRNIKILKANAEVLEWDRDEFERICYEQLGEIEELNSKIAELEDKIKMLEKEAVE